MPQPKGHWLVKSEPSAYGWANLVKDGRTEWTGIRNFEARNNLRAMQVGDLVLFYHSVVEKQVVGVARVSRAGVPDATARGEDWTSVELLPLKALASPVTLEAMARDAALRAFPLLKKSRLSVVPVTAAQYRRILELAKKRPPAAPSPRRKR
jgi:predicted RNA-binding protein with PUA-like domain